MPASLTPDPALAMPARLEPARSWLGIPGVVWLLAVLAAAYVVKVAYSGNLAAFHQHGDAFVAYWLDDAYQNLVLARSLFQGHGFVDGVPTAWREPGEPALLALAFRLGGFGYPALLAAHGSAIVVTVLATYCLGEQVGGVRTGCLAALLTAANLQLLRIAAIPYSEVTTLALISLALMFLGRFQATRRTRTLAWAALFLALTAMTRATFLAAFPLIWVGLAWQGHRWRTLAIGALPFLLLVGSWTLRNAVVLHRFVPVSERLTWVAVLDNQMSALQTPFWRPYRCEFLTTAEHQVLYEHLAAPDTAAYPVVLNARSARILRQNLSRHPWLYVRRCLRRLIALYSPYLLDQAPLLRGVQALRFALVILPGLVALAVYRRAPWVLPGMVTVLMVTATATLVINEGQQRYRLPFEPFLAVASAALLSRRGYPLRGPATPGG